MKEMIERLIADGWEWVADNSDGSCSVYDNKPVVQDNYFVLEHGHHKYSDIPSCLFPDLTFETSPVELKTLLVDEEQDNIQREIKILIVWKFEYLLKQGNGDVSAYSADGTEWRNANRLKNFVPEVHEKVYLKDLVKKRKVKKSVWVGRSLTDYYLTVDGVDYSHTEKFPFEFLFQGRDKDVTEFELTYEVEE